MNVADCGNSLASRYTDVVRRVSFAVISILTAIGISLVLSTFGTHGPLGAFSVYAGFPGGFVNWKANHGHISYLLITIVNAVFYLGVFELIAVVIQRRSGSHPPLKGTGAAPDDKRASYG
jgi:hypothetical protein